MGRVDEEQAAFKKLILSGIKKSNSRVLKTFNNCNNND